MNCELDDPAALPPEERDPRYQLNRRPSGLRCPSGCLGEKKDMLHVSGVEPRLLGSVSYSLVSIATEQYIHSVPLPEDSIKLGTFCLIILSNSHLLQGKR